ncbi:DUF202 domain-containing protein [Nocardioides sp. 616]|uniref:DUF202 domain-containing protein n=1 Tax=Nocardioides sp. 616 TaxID=2268090 RepID=UPI000CE4BB9C|nr:DUF202 domain-containing protein [Nocardioides sp. 616]
MSSQPPAGSLPPGEPDPLDPGGSEARDVLGWQRTTLTMLAVAVACARHTWSILGAYALLPMGLLVLASAWTLGDGWHRYDEDREGIEQASGVPTFLVAGTVALIAGIEVVYLLRR